MSHVLATLGIAATLGLLASSVGSQAQSPERPAADGSCHAAVTNDGLNVAQCPLAPIHFHISVADCQDSKGTFVYHYLRVEPGRKETVQRTAAWIAHSKEWDITERVPLSCGEEADGAEAERVTDCSCVKR